MFEGEGGRGYYQFLDDGDVVLELGAAEIGMLILREDLASLELCQYGCLVRF